MCQKTDARGITTTYSYDAIDRLIGKTYSDSTNPAVFTYGPVGASNNTADRLIDEKTTNQTAVMNERAIDAYDAMGRVTAERQCFTGGCSIGTNYKLTHSYDLAGDTIGSNNGITGTNAVSLSDNYDQAGHLESVTSSLNDATHPSTLFQATGFNAFALTGANYAVPNGSGTPGFSQTLSYDVRMRLDGETDAATNPSATLYSYSVGRDLAGNVTALTGDMEMGTWGYSYDALNRLQAATATVGGYNGLTLTEAYDSFGNRESQTASGSYKGTVPQPGAPGLDSETWDLSTVSTIGRVAHSSRACPERP